MEDSVLLLQGSSELNRHTLLFRTFPKFWSSRAARIVLPAPSAATCILRQHVVIPGCPTNVRPGKKAVTRPHRESCMHPRRVPADTFVRTLNSVYPCRLQQSQESDGEYSLSTPSLLSQRSQRAGSTCVAVAPAAQVITCTGFHVVLSCYVGLNGSTYSSKGDLSAQEEHSVHSIAPQTLPQPHPAEEEPRLQQGCHLQLFAPTSGSLCRADP